MLEMNVFARLWSILKTSRALWMWSCSNLELDLCMEGEVREGPRKEIALYKILGAFENMTT
jgi:hypothetical protein